MMYVFVYSVFGDFNRPTSGLSKTLQNPTTQVHVCQNRTRSHSYHEIDSCSTSSRHPAVQGTPSFVTCTTSAEYWPWCVVKQVRSASLVVVGTWSEGFKV